MWDYACATAQELVKNKYIKSDEQQEWAYEFLERKIYQLEELLEKKSK